MLPRSIQEVKQDKPEADCPCSSVMCVRIVPTNEIVTDLDDHEYVNWETSASDVGDTTAGAGIRIMKGRAKQDDRDQVRQYQKHHMWSPLTSEPSSALTPLAKRAYPGRDGDATNDEAPPIKPRNHTNNEPTRPRSLCSADFEDSDDEDDISTTGTWEVVGVVRPLEDILQCPEAEMRKVQLLLQAKILREIAELVHEPSAD